ncbi:nuclear GTPase SLIP-GC-like isoform 6-T7 [Fundulus diaphanus]
MDTFVRDKLNQWNLSEFMEIFKEEEVDKNRLFCLEDEDIDKLIPKVGPRARFKERLKQLKCQQQNEEETNSSEILFSTSDIGKRKFDLQEESRAEKPAVKRQRASIQFSEAVILNDVKAIMEHVYEKLHNRESTELNEFLKTKIRDLEVDKRAVVGVFGKTGSGKTSLINSVIGVNKLLPSGDVDACTSVMIKVEANVNNSTYEAEIEFIPKDEWEDELGTVDRFLEQDGEQEKQDDDDDDDDDNDGYHDLVEKLSALYGEEWKEKSSEQLMDIRYFREIPEFLNSTKKILICESATELSAKILKYTKQGGDGGIKRWYWPLVKCVTVKVPKNNFLQHVTLVDLPGNGDRNKSRDSMWKGIVGNCSAVWIVSEINRAASDKESWEVLKRASSLLGNGGECRHIHFICTKSDVIGDLHDHSAANVQAFILKRNIKAKEAVSKELNKLTKIKTGINKVVCEDLESNLDCQLDAMRNVMREIYTNFGKCLDEGVEISKRSCEKILKSFLYNARKSGSCQYNILKGVVRNGGIHKPKKGKEINFNVKLTSFLSQSIDEEFRKTFPNEGNHGPFNGVINKFSLDTEKLKQKYKDAELHLVFLKTEEEKLKTKLCKRIRDRKKMIYIILTKTVEETMAECYKRAAQFHGKNTLQNIKEKIQKHVHNFKNSMFEKAKDVMLEQLLKLMVEILGLLEKNMMESIELSLQSEDNSIPDVSTELSMVQKHWNELNSCMDA